MNDTMLGKIKTKNGIKILLSIICFKYLNVASKLSRDHGMKGLKYGGCFADFSLIRNVQVVLV